VRARWILFVGLCDPLVAGVGAGIRRRRQQAQSRSLVPGGDVAVDTDGYNPLEAQYTDTMRVRDWDDILRDVVESDADPAGWRAVGGDRANGIGEDLYVAHPEVGAFQLKTYAKNPFEVEGVGTRVARRVDEDIEPLFPNESDGRGLFGVQEPVEDEETAEERVNDLETVVETHAEAPTTPQALFEDVMDALDSPAYGPMEFDNYDRPEQMGELTDTFQEAEELLEAEFDDIVDGSVDRGFH